MIRWNSELSIKAFSVTLLVLIVFLGNTFLWTGFLRKNIDPLFFREMLCVERCVNRLRYGVFHRKLYDVHLVFLYRETLFETESG